MHPLIWLAGKTSRPMKRGRMVIITRTTTRPARGSLLHGGILDSIGRSSEWRQEERAGALNDRKERQDVLFPASYTAACFLWQPGVSCSFVGPSSRRLVVVVVVVFVLAAHFRLPPPPPPPLVRQDAPNTRVLSVQNNIPEVALNALEAAAKCSSLRPRQGSNLMVLMALMLLMVLILLMPQILIRMRRRTRLRGRKQSLSVETRNWRLLQCQASRAHHRQPFN